MPDVFVSYSEEDEKIAIEIVSVLEARGFSIWHFLRDSTPGVSYASQIVESIAECHCFVLLVSKRSLASASVNEEMRHAKRMHKRILPILVDVTADELSKVRPEWAEALGDAAFAQWNEEPNGVVLDAVARGIDALIVRSLVSSEGCPARITFVAEADSGAEPPIGRSFPVVLRASRYMLRPQGDLRVAFSALLKIAQGDRYLLIRNFHRLESFAPLGGVYKYMPSAIPALDAVGFRPQSIGPGRDMVGDLRGFLPFKNFNKILRWFASGRDRESAPACLTREFDEEMDEPPFHYFFEAPREMAVRRVRRVEEGPEPVPGQNYLQYRIFDVFEPCASPDASQFIAKLFRVENDSYGQLVAATSSDIIRGRVGPMALVGSHSAYLFGSKRYHPHSPLFITEQRG